MVILLEEWHKRIPDYEVVGTPTEHSGGVHGLNDLRLRWSNWGRAFQASGLMNWLPTSLPGPGLREADLGRQPCLLGCPRGCGRRTTAPDAVEFRTCQAHRRFHRTSCNLCPRV